LKLLITGGQGALGRELVRLHPGSMHPSHRELDITNGKAVMEFLRKEKPDRIIHCAALTGIRQCEEDKPLAWKVNVEGTENLVRASGKLGSEPYFTYISSACVFSGDRGNYVESDVPDPKNYYALTKLMGEAAVRYSGLERWLIVRTNFVPREKWRYPRAFKDRYGTYLFADEVAEAIKSITARKMLGVVHVRGSRRLSMFQLASMTTPQVLPMTLDDYEGPPLTVDMTLGSERLPAFRIHAD
jgi:dTDP-4-dehydrorhamnose reductase